MSGISNVVGQEKVATRLTRLALGRLRRPGGGPGVVPRGIAIRQGDGAMEDVATLMERVREEAGGFPVMIKSPLEDNSRGLQHRRQIARAEGARAGPCSHGRATAEVGTRVDRRAAGEVGRCFQIRRCRPLRGVHPGARVSVRRDRAGGRRRIGKVQRWQLRCRRSHHRSPRKVPGPYSGHAGVCHDQPGHAHPDVRRQIVARMSRAKRS